MRGAKEKYVLYTRRHENDPPKPAFIEMFIAETAPFCDRGRDGFVREVLAWGDRATLMKMKELAEEGKNDEQNEQNEQNEHNEHP